jgi:isocitrate/isopropylmalate dehydrogenase
MAQKTAAIIRGDGTGPELVEAMIKAKSNICHRKMEKVGENTIRAISIANSIFREYLQSIRDKIKHIINPYDSNSN